MKNCGKRLRKLKTPNQKIRLGSSAVDKIFAASGSEVKGYTRKGKVFLTLDTTVSETIVSMCVLGADLVVGSGRMVTQYRDLKELYSYTCEDRVLDLAAFAAPNSTRVRILVLVANKGALMLESGQELARTTMKAGPVRLAIIPVHHHDPRAFYGAADGSLGLITYDGSQLSTQCLVEGRGFGVVVCAGWWLSNGTVHLAIGRHDGCVQLYGIDMDNLQDKPRLRFSYFCGEPVTSVCGGNVGTEEGELLIATYSGRIFALRSRHLSPESNISYEAMSSRRAKLQSEIAKLEKQVSSERERYQRDTRAHHAGLSAPPLLEVECELSVASNRWHEILLTSAVPLDMLFMYSTKKLELQTDSAVVLSVCPSQCGSHNDPELLATVRCQAGTRRLWVRARTVDGEVTSGGTKILLYVLPTGAPRVARLITIRLPMLPYYTIHKNLASFEEENRTWCELQVKGSFSVAEMSSWLVQALPGELPRAAPSIALVREDTLVHSFLLCEYKRGNLSVKSDNISTITALKNIVTSNAIHRSIRLDINCDVPKDCVPKAFKRIEEDYKNEYKRNGEYVLQKALCSLDLETVFASEELPQLCGDYLKAWQASIKDSEIKFYELVDTIEQWYEDHRKLKLSSSEGERNRLRAALCDNRLHDITEILADLSKW